MLPSKKNKYIIRLLLGQKHVYVDYISLYYETDDVIKSFVFLKIRRFIEA